MAVEAWWFWGASASADAGVFVGLELRGSRFDWWGGLVRAGEPYLYVEELDGTGLRAGLEIKPPEMWADHVCDVAFRQWSVAVEAHGVLLEDPTEAWRRAHGIPVPVTFDVEWYAAGDPEPLGDGRIPGYRQAGEVDVEVQLLEGVLAFQGAAERVHVWSVPHLPTSFAMPNDTRGLRAPYRRSDGRRVDQVLTPARWWVAAAG